jgi:ABC-2 type transport system permease protein
VTAFIRFEVVRTLRNVRYLAFLIVMPVVFYLVWGRQSGAPGMIAMSVWAACGAALLGSGNTIAEDRFTGWLRQLRATPLSNPAWLGGKIIQGVLMVVPGVVAVCLVAVFVGHVRLDPGQWALLAVLMLVGALPFALVGVFGGMLFKGKTATVALMLVFFAMMFLSGIIGGQALVSWPAVFPTYDLLQLGIEVTRDQPINGLYLAVLGAWAVVGGVAVLLRWRRA